MLNYQSDRADWEPNDASAWAERDPLISPLREIGGLFSSNRITSSQYDSSIQQAFLAWSSLPPLLRRQVWREREIAAALYRLRSSWAELSTAFTMGVGWRRIDGIRKLSGIVSVDSPVDNSTLMNERFDLPAELTIESIIPSDEISSVSAPIVIEYAARPVQYGVVDANRFILASADPLPLNAPTLQSGDVIGGENTMGFRAPGTLTAIVSNENDVTPMLLSAGHVFGDVGNKVVAEIPVPMHVGKVIKKDTFLDIGIAELDDPYALDYRLKALNIVPAAPIMPYSNMEVQIYGGRSGHQMGYIDQVNSIPVNGTAVGIVPDIRVSITANPGDSGSLLVSGHGKMPPAVHGSKHMNSAYINSLTCSMIGLLIAGPAQNVITTMRPQVYFRPIVDVLAQFNLQLWTRKI